MKRRVYILQHWKLIFQTFLKAHSWKRKNVSNLCCWGLKMVLFLVQNVCFLSWKLTCSYRILIVILDKLTNEKLRPGRVKYSFYTCSVWKSVHYFYLYFSQAFSYIFEDETFNFSKNVQLGKKGDRRETIKMYMLGNDGELMNINYCQSTS